MSEDAVTAGAGSAPAAARLTPLTGTAGSGPVTLSALPARVDLLLYAGDEFVLRIDVTGDDGEPADLDGAAPASQIREAPGAAQVAGEFDAWTGDEPGLVWLRLSPAEARGLPARAVWDAKLSWDDGDRVTTLAAGTVRVTERVTRPAGEAP